MKLQKLAFYSNALSLVCDDKPLFREQFQAWVNGPVCPELFDAHRGKFIVGPGELGVHAGPELTEHERALVNRVLDVLGPYDGETLSKLTHSEAPWIDARRGYQADSRCSEVITNRAIKEFYSSPLCASPMFLSIRA